jgi:hypothetical protein
VRDGELSPFRFVEESNDGVHVNHLTLRHRFSRSFYNHKSSRFRFPSNLCELQRVIDDLPFSPDAVPGIV